MEQNGAGELVIQSIDRDGQMNGFDIEIIREVSARVGVPVVALGGAGSRADLIKAYQEGNATGLAAGSIFVYKDRNRGVLINYPENGELRFSSEQGVVNGRL